MHLRSFATALCLAVPIAAQAQDIGLMVAPGPLPVIIGQQCGPVSCNPIGAGSVPAGAPLSLLHASAPVAPFALGIGFPGPCVTIAGIQNTLLLDQASLIVATAGLTSSEPFVPTPCQQGLAGYTLTLPPTAPTGLLFRVQSVGTSNSGAIAFGPTLEFTVQ